MNCDEGGQREKTLAVNLLLLWNSVRHVPLSRASRGDHLPAEKRARVRFHCIHGLFTQTVNWGKANIPSLRLSVSLCGVLLPVKLTLQFELERSIGRIQ